MIAPRLPRLFLAMMAVAAASGVVLAVLRIASLLPADGVPFQGYTSGDEQASLYAVWRWVQGLPVHTSRFEPPFNGVFFNWLFYVLYGSLTGAVLKAAALPDAWLPTVARVITMVGAGLAGLAAYGAMTATGVVDGRRRRIAAVLAVLLACGPLMGYWLVTVRPDVWALALEIVAAGLFLRLFPRRPLAAVAVAALFCYLAWAFKQANVATLGGIGLFLLARRNWRGVLLLPALMAALWGATLALGSPQYVKSVLFAGFPLFYELSSLVRTLGNMGVKTLGLWGAATAILAALAADRRVRIALWRDDGVALGLCGSLVALGVMGLASLQTGAGENYFFSLAFHLALTTVAGMAVLGEVAERWYVRAAAAGAAGWAAVAVATGLALGGVVGTTDLRYMHTAFTAWKACLDPMPRPVFVDNVYMSLPWMTPATEPFVLSFLYRVERDMGKPFAGDGIGGLVARGHFATIAVPAPEAPAAIDSANLDGYGVAKSCQGLQVLLRRDLMKGEGSP